MTRVGHQQAIFGVRSAEGVSAAVLFCLIIRAAQVISSCGSQSGGRCHGQPWMRYRNGTEPWSSCYTFYWGPRALLRAVDACQGRLYDVNICNSTEENELRVSLRDQASLRDHEPSRRSSSTLQLMRTIVTATCLEGQSLCRVHRNCSQSANQKRVFVCTSLSACPCNPLGSRNSTCQDPYTNNGQCICHNNVEGEDCSKCNSSYYNLTSGNGCSLCQCNRTGSTSEVCDSETGQCLCKYGTVGEHCDECLPGFMWIHEHGCKPICDEGWRYYNRSCYLALKERNKSKASKSCENKYSQLVAPELHTESAAEGQFFTTLCHDKHSLDSQKVKFYIGLSDSAEEGIFVWSNNNQSLGARDYAGWGMCEPDEDLGSPENCVHVQYYKNDGWHWNDIQCSMEMPFVCEKKGPCDFENGWTDYRGSCYKFYCKEKRYWSTWTEADAECRQMSAFLVNVGSQYEEEFLINSFRCVCSNRQKYWCKRKACECNTAGRVNRSATCNQTTGNCSCKIHTINPQCDVCEAGYYFHSSIGCTELTNETTPPVHSNPSSPDHTTAIPTYSSTAAKFMRNQTSHGTSPYTKIGTAEVTNETTPPTQSSTSSIVQTAHSPDHTTAAPNSRSTKAVLTTTQTTHGTSTSAATGATELTNETTPPAHSNSSSPDNITVLPTASSTTAVLTTNQASHGTSPYTSIGTTGLTNETTPPTHSNSPSTVQTAPDSTTAVPTSSSATTVQTTTQTPHATSAATGAKTKLASVKRQSQQLKKSQGNINRKDTKLIADFLANTNALFKDNSRVSKLDLDEISATAVKEVGRVLRAPSDVVTTISSLLVVRTVETIGSYSPPLELGNKTYANQTKVVDSFSQTIVDINTTSTEGNITLDIPQTLQPQLNEMQHDVQVSGPSIKGHRPLVSLRKDFLKNIACSRVTKTGCIQRLQFNIYTTDALFREPENASSSLSAAPTVNSWVIGVKVNDQESVVVSQPIVWLSFRVFTTGKDWTQHCASWNFTKNGGLGGWSNAGIITITEGGITTCTSTHLTNFAVLLSRNVDTSESLTLASIIALSLSSAGLLATIVAHLFIRQLRHDTQSRIIVCLSINLLALNLLVLLGADQTEHTTLCQVVAMAIHYFLLASFGWMTVEAVQLYLKIIRVFNSEIHCFIRKAVLLAQGIPVIIVAITAGSAFNDYGDDSFCCLVVGTPFYLTVVLPLLVTTVFTYAVYCSVQYQLKKRQASNPQPATKARKNRLRASLSLATLTGLTWGIGLILLIESHTVVQWFFVVLVATQGLFIFYFQVFAHRNLRSILKEMHEVKSCTMLGSSGSSGSSLLSFSSTGKTTRLSWHTIAGSITRLLFGANRSHSEVPTTSDSRNFHAIPEDDTKITAVGNLLEREVRMMCFANNIGNKTCEGAASHDCHGGTARNCYMNIPALEENISERPLEIPVPVFETVCAATSNGSCSDDEDERYTAEPPLQQNVN